MPRIIPDVLKNLFSKPFTLKYPSEKREPPKDTRGKIKIDREECIECGICKRVCPPHAISYDDEDKPVIDLGLCIFCGECVDACPVNALSRSKEYELGLYDRDNAFTE